MARRAASGNRGMGEWVKTFGEQLGVELGRVIADSLQRTLLASIDIPDIARRLGGGASAGKRGRRASAGQRSACAEAGCPNPVLAKGLCRSHYYRQRYRSQKGGAPAAARGKRAAKATAPAAKRSRTRKPAKTPVEAQPTETAAG